MKQKLIKKYNNSLNKACDIINYELQEIEDLRYHSTKTIIIGYVLLLVANFGDLLTTYLILLNGGSELNILPSIMLNKFGFMSLIVLKVLFIIAIILFCERIKERYSYIAVATIYTMVGLFITAIWFNVLNLIWYFA